MTLSDADLTSADTRKALRALSGGHPNDQRHVWYAVAGKDLDPAAVTELTAIQPDRSWQRGDPKPRTGLPYADGAWLLDSGLGSSDEFHDHLDALLARLRPAWSAFVDLGRRYEATIEAAIYCYEVQGPLVQVVPDVASAISELNATLGFDIYALAEGSDNPPAHVSFTDAD